jgi:hypothetical protein
MNGWIKHHRRELRSAIWNMPPLYHKVWDWLKLNVDWSTGQIVTTAPDIAEGVQWVERRRPRIPNRKTIRDILNFMHDEKMIDRQVEGSRNAKYLRITLCNWETYQSKDGPSSNAGVTPEKRNADRKLDRKLDRQLAGVVEEVKEVKETTTTPREREVPRVDFTKNAVTPLSRECELLPATEEFEQAEQGLIALCRELREKHSRITVDPNLLTRVPRALHCDPYMPQQWTPDQIRACVTNWLEFGHPGQPQSLWKPIDSKDPDGELHYERCLTMGMKNRNGHPKKLTIDEQVALAMGPPINPRPWEDKK